MMETLTSEQDRILLVIDAIMESGVCSSGNFNGKLFAEMCGCTPAFLDSLLYGETGYRTSAFIAVCRIYTMKRLLLAGVEYKTVLKTSGFRSPCQLERALDYIVI